MEFLLLYEVHFTHRASGRYCSRELARRHYSSLRVTRTGFVCAIGNAGWVGALMVVVFVVRHCIEVCSWPEISSRTLSIRRYWKLDFWTLIAFRYFPNGHWRSSNVLPTKTTHRQLPSLALWFQYRSGHSSFRFRLDNL